MVSDTVYHGSLATSGHGSHPTPNVDTKRSVFFKARYLTGVYLLNIAGITAWIWGNLSVYTRSFMYSRLEDVTGVDIPWVVPLYFIGWCLGLLTTNTVTKYLKRKPTLILAILLSSTCIGVSYFTLKLSVTVFNIFFGFLPGYGSGVVFALQLIFVVEFTDKYLGFFTSTVNSCTLILGFTANLLITFYINPENEEPGKMIGRIKVFSQPDILDRVPDIFLFYALVSLGCGVVGIMLMLDKTKNPESQKLIDTGVIDIITEDLNNKPIKKRQASEKKSHNHNRGEQVSKQGNEKDVEIEKNEKIMNHKHQIVDDLKPRCAIKTCAFYILWMVGAVSNTSFVTLSSYYKTFGLVRIPDDHFMTNVGTLLIVIVGIFIPVSGVLVDRYGVKNCLIGHTSSLTILLALYPFTTMISQWLFFVTTILYGCLSYTLYPIVSVATLICFGNSYHTTNYGLVNTSSVLVNSIVPVILGIVVKHLGFFGIFFLNSSIALIGTIAIIVFLPRV